MIAKQSTALTVVIGPILDSTGAEYASAVIGDLSISKNGGTLTAMASAATLTYIANGMYTLVTTTANMDTLGAVQVTCNKATYQMPKMERNIVPASVYDAIIINATNATGGLPTATAAITGLAGVISTYAGGAVASVTNPVTVGTNNDKTGYTATVSDKTGFKLASDGLALVTAWTVGITGNLTGNVTGSVGSISGVSFPANFSLLGIGVTGAILLVDTVDELGASALTANGAVDAIPTAVWNALTTTTYTDQSFGDRILISTNNNRDVAVTGSNHVAAVLHDAQPNSIPEDAFQNGAVSARVIATDAIDGDAMASSANTKIANAVAAPSAAAIADAVWDEILVGHLGAGTTGEALNNSGGSGNPWITDIATGYSGTQAGNVLNQVKAKTDLITSGNVQTSIPVTAQGQINGPLYIGDDYLTANGRQFDWTIALPTGFVAANSTCKFGMIFEDESGVSEFNLSGTVADVGSGNVRLRFELPKATTGTLKAGFHRWSTEIVSATGAEVTAVAYSDRKLVEWREKQT